MRIAVVSDSHLAPVAEELLPNWEAAKQFISRSAVDLTIHLGDVTLDGANRSADLRYARSVIGEWPTRIRFLPGNHDIGDNPWGPGQASPHPLNLERLRDYRESALASMEQQLFSTAPVYDSLEKLTLALAFERLKENLGNAEVIKRVLGEGGMATVFVGRHLL